MISYALAIALAISGQHVTNLVWVDKIKAKVVANREAAGSKVTKPPPTVGKPASRNSAKKSKVTYSSATQEGGNILVVDLGGPVIEVRDLAIEEIQRGQIQTAIRRLETAWFGYANRHGQFILAPVLTDAYLMVGRNVEALNTMAPYANQSTGYLERLAYVAALNGIAEPGQKEYCIHSLTLGDSSMSAEAATWLPTGNRPQDILLPAAVALGKRLTGYAQKFYLQRAVALDPTHPYAHQYLGDIARNEQRYREAVQHYEVAMRRSGPIGREYIEHWLKRVRYRRDATGG
ncbi:MAG TPA: tetratricopeptide repeat protein [Fimbriimonadaceae bacterium]|nr:tetratricopeptide repeat protein [Fimbriimonadaceae bacterium]